MSTVDVEKAAPLADGLPRRRLPDLGRYGGVSIGLVALVLYMSVTQAGFLSFGNLMGILETNAALLVCSVGMTFVVLLGGFDLSVGGFLALGSVMLAQLIGAGTSPWLAILLVAVGGVAASALTNAGFIAVLGLNFFVVTIATDALTGGLALVVSKGRTLPLYDSNFIVSLGTTTVAGIPVTVLLAVAVVVVAVLTLRFTGFGRMVYAVGGNAEAARLVGINVKTVKATAYLMCTLCAVVAGLIMSSRIQSAGPTMGSGIALQAAAAVLLGGTSFMGGEGGLFGTVLGVLLLGVLSNALIILGVSGFWHGVVTGAVLLGAILTDWARSRLGRLGRPRRSSAA